jgi:hypothetical protein
VLELSEQARSAVEKLLNTEESQLYEELGIRSQAIAKNPALSSAFEPEVVYEGAYMGPLDYVRELGERIFKRLEFEMYGLFCGSAIEDEEARIELGKAFGIGQTEIALAMSALLITQLGLAPAIAAVMAALIIKHVFKPSYEEFCGLWGEKFPKSR